MAVRREGSLAGGADLVLDLRASRRIHRTLVNSLAAHHEKDRHQA
jgi:hypothetical protein